MGSGLARSKSTKRMLAKSRSMRRIQRATNDAQNASPVAPRKSKKKNTNPERDGREVDISGVTPNERLYDLGPRVFERPNSSGSRRPGDIADMRDINEWRKKHPAETVFGDITMDTELAKDNGVTQATSESAGYREGEGSEPPKHKEDRWNRRMSMHDERVEATKNFTALKKLKDD